MGKLGSGLNIKLNWFIDASISLYKKEEGGQIVTLNITNSFLESSGWSRVYTR